jgi:hypothetical protein
MMRSTRYRIVDAIVCDRRIATRRDRAAARDSPTDDASGSRHTDK